MSNSPTSPSSPASGKEKELAVSEASSSNSKPSSPKESSEVVNEDAENGDKEESKEDKEGEEKEPGSSTEAPPNEWQAVWSPAHNAYYFYNSRTNETTWTNPLIPPSSEVSSETAGPSSISAPQETPQTSSALVSEDALDGIDPALAHLDPTLYDASRGKGKIGPGQAFQARFNSRTGRFTAMNDRDPSHLSEYARAQRMSEVFFDVHKWEEDLASRGAGDDDSGEGSGDKRKRPTKKDMERFKEAKRQKKIAKNAWLRN